MKYHLGQLPSAIFFSKELLMTLLKTATRQQISGNADNFADIPAAYPKTERPTSMTPSRALKATEHQIRWIYSELKMSSSSYQGRYLRWLVKVHHITCLCYNPK